MYTLLEPHPRLEHFVKLQQAIAAKLIAKAANGKSEYTLPAGSNLFSQIESTASFFAVTEGHLAFKIGGKSIFFYNEGDLIGIEQNLVPGDCEVSADFGVKLSKFTMRDLFDSALGDPETMTDICAFLSVQTQIMSLITVQLLKGEENMSPEVNHYDKGEVIISQGAAPDLVYTLLEGRAEAFVDGVKVGEIEADQIFGALAVVTDTPRTATVKAASSCVVVGISKEHFINLIQARPQTVLKLVEDMARTIVSLNDQVVGLTKAHL